MQTSKNSSFLFFNTNICHPRSLFLYSKRKSFSRFVLKRKHLEFDGSIPHWSSYLVFCSSSFLPNSHRHTELQSFCLFSCFLCGSTGYFHLSKRRHFSSLQYMSSFVKPSFLPCFQPSFSVLTLKVPVLHFAVNASSHFQEEPTNSVCLNSPAILMLCHLLIWNITLTFISLILGAHWAILFLLCPSVSSIHWYLFINECR